jgi:hypothetical protein
MDPFTIAGLTSSIITFIEFGVKLVSAVKALRNSPQDTIPEVEEFDLIINNVKSLNAKILRANPNGRKLSKHEQDIVSMATTCDDLATELSSILQSLRIRDGAWSRTVERTRVVVTAFRKKDGIGSLLFRLERLDTRLRENVNRIMQDQILSELRALRDLQECHEINYDTKLESTRTDILQLTGKQTNDAADPLERSRLKESLDLLDREGQLRRWQIKVINSLFFKEIRRRWDKITTADDRTNDWLFDRTGTSFLKWLESGNGIYWITGKAGSGKSTLMKFASQHSATVDALKTWAQPAEPYYSSFYFWNQGYDMQKSQKGLLQSLVYQILRKFPDIIADVVPEGLDLSNWETPILKATLLKIVDLASLPVKFCFFIDGLDEYDGDEEDLVDLLDPLSKSPRIKLCVSSRPRPVLDEAYQHCRQTLVIQDFTKEDMKRHVRIKLQANHKFRKLQQASGFECDGIMTQIAEQAHGVWLWVSLVTHSLDQAVNRDEGISKLQDILHKFPPSLEKYFEHIIRGIDPSYKEEMAQIFLITVEEVQPLPLFAFSLLERERADPDYAVVTPTTPLPIDEVEQGVGPWKSRIHNRCRDLLVVEDGEHPTFLFHPVDFLHRTVRDFLRDCYYKELKNNLKSDFSPLLSLCKMMLFFLKSLPAVDPRQRPSITRFIKIVDELLYYAHEVEKREQLPDSPLVDILDQVDRVGCLHTAGSMRNHWTHVRDSPAGRGYDEYPEGGKCNFLALTIQARLVHYVRAKLKADPGRMKKPGRPLLDYALRPRRLTPISMPYHSRREDTSIDIDMVQLLLENGANPNQEVHLNDGRTVWALFLLSSYESTQRGETTPALKNAWYRVSELMISHGAKEKCWFDNGDQLLTVSRILHAVFGADKATNLLRRMQEVKEQRPEGLWLLRWFQG